MPSLSFPQYPVTKANMPGVLLIGGALVCAASPTIFAGKGFTVSKTGTGVFRVTFNKKVGHVLSAPANLVKLAATTEARFLNAVLLTDGTNYVEWRVEDATGAAADPATTDRIAFVVMVMTERLPMV